jgi:8-oxo-dGTP pyrophosphatase MutT (NUDIX family)
MKIDKSWYIKPGDNSFPTKTNSGGVVVRKNDGKLLVALIRDRKFKEYMLPKGGVESGEDFVQTAKREISEETGISKLNFICDLGIKQRLVFEKNVWATTHYLLFITNQNKGEQKLQVGEDYKVEWFDIDKLPDMFWPEQKKLVEENLEKIKKSI